MSTRSLHNTRNTTTLEERNKKLSKGFFRDTWKKWRCKLVFNQYLEYSAKFVWPISMMLCCHAELHMVRPHSLSPKHHHLCFMKMFSIILITFAGQEWFCPLGFLTGNCFRYCFINWPISMNTFNCYIGSMRKTSTWAEFLC